MKEEYLYMLSGKNMVIWGDGNKIEDVNGIVMRSFTYSEGVYIVEIDNRLFLAMNKTIINPIKNRIGEGEQPRSINISAEKTIRSRISFGGENSFIVDMQGIKNFINASFLDFKDYYIRTILTGSGMMKGKNYLRIGVSGAPNTGKHPGGEVFEEQLVNGRNGGGISGSYSGYLLDEEGYSKGISLSIDGTMIEDRMVYSHTAYLEESANSRTIYKRILCEDNLELVEYVKLLAEQEGLEAFASQMFLKANDDEGIRIKGRVLKRRPQKAFKYLYEATEIGNIKEFQLNSGQQLMIAGTFYNRKDADWFDFTNGREYERRGHYHVRILNDCTEAQHEVFHLRELRVINKATVHLLITPIEHILKITPIAKTSNTYKCPVTGKSIEKLINEFV